MHWRVKGFFYWAVALGAYVAGWQTFELIKRQGMSEQVALGGGITVGVAALGILVAIILKVRKSINPNINDTPADADGDGLNDRQRRLMAALGQAADADGEVVIHTKDGPHPEYIVETADRSPD